MTKLILLTGFLGAGKTTLLKKILEIYKEEKIGVIVNEFGEINIDAVLIKEKEFKVAELSNGSIFCSCIKENFINSLINMSINNLQYLFIEASGLADPASMAQIVDAISSQIKCQYDYKGAICVVDPENFLELSDMLPALDHQVQYSSVGIINKADLVNEDKIKKVSKKISELNLSMEIVITSFCKIDIKELVEGLVPVGKIAMDSTNTVENRPKTFVMKADTILPRKKIQEFMENIAPDTYRIKGFAKTDHGNLQISAVGKNIIMSEWNEPLINTEIVAISSVGIKLLSRIVQESNTCLDGLLHL